MALPEHTIDVGKLGKDGLYAMHNALDGGRVKSRAYLGGTKGHVIVHLPPEVYIRDEIIVGGNLEIYTSRYAKLPEICIKDDKGMRCNLKLDAADLFDISAHKGVFEAYRELIKEKPELESYFRSIVRRVVISKVDHRPEVEAIAHSYADGTCDIVLYDDMVFDKDVKQLKRILVHELGHCIENYARRRKYVGTSRGQWVDGRPIGSEKRAEKFAKRIVGFSPFL